MRAAITSRVAETNFCEWGYFKKKVLGRDYAQSLAGRATALNSSTPSFSAFDDEVLSPSNANLFNRSVKDRWNNCRLLSGGSDLSPAIYQWINNVFRATPKLLSSTEFGSLNNWSVRNIDSDNSVECKMIESTWTDWLRTPPLRVYCGIIVLTPDEEHTLDLSLFDEFCRERSRAPSSLVNREVKHYFLRSGDGVLWDETQTISIQTTRCCSVVSFRLALAASGEIYIWS